MDEKTKCEGSVMVSIFVETLRFFYESQSNTKAMRLPSKSFLYSVPIHFHLSLVILNINNNPVSMTYNIYIQWSGTAHRFLLDTGLTYLK